MSNNHSDNCNRDDFYASDDDILHHAASSHQRPQILWSCVSRNEVILAEAGDDIFGGAVAQTARELLARKATPGYEFHTQSLLGKFMNHSATTPTTTTTAQSVSAPRLKGVKFHYYEHDSEHEAVRMYVYAAVYDPSTEIDRVQVQSFLEKICAISQNFRDDPDPANPWKVGGTLCCQESFAPLLLQRMQEVTYLGKMAMLEEQLDSSKATMQQNIELLLDRQETLEGMREETTKLQDMASVFKKRSRKVRRMKMMQDAKHGLILGTAVTAGVACIVVPPLIAIL